jgi:tetratricopeptide (TPR) repeat protein
MLALLLGLATVIHSTPAQRPTADPATIAARALEHQRAGRLEQAARAYEEFLALVPSSWEAHSNLGVVYAQLGRHQDAIREYREALAAQPGQVAVRYNLALALYKAARVGDAATELRGVLASAPDHESAYLLLADCQLQLGHWKRVIDLLDPRLEEDPENPAILYMIGTALMRDKQYERGQRVLDRILRQGDSAEAHLLLALASREANDDLSAKEELDEALALNPELPMANGLLGAVLMRMGEGQAAMESFRRELAINPNDFESHLLLGALLRQEFQNDGAREHLDRALALRPRDPAVRYQLALVDIATGDLGSARQTLEELVDEAPKWLEAHVSLTSVYYRLRLRERGDRQQAIVKRLRQEDEARRAEERARKEEAQP